MRTTVLVAALLGSLFLTGAAQAAPGGAARGGVLQLLEGAQAQDARIVCIRRGYRRICARVRPRRRGLSRCHRHGRIRHCHYYTRRHRHYY